MHSVPDEPVAMTSTGLLSAYQDVSAISYRSMISEVSSSLCPMAKSDSFFIRQTLDCANLAGPAGFEQVEIDLGAYVSALGKSVLRIHNIAVAVTDNAGRSPDIAAGGSGGEAKNAAVNFQLTTQTQTNIVVASNKSVVASGLLNACNLDATAGVASVVSESFDNLPQLWTNGYLIATESMYLGGSASTHWTDDIYVSVTLECTVETMSQASAMALSLSQQ